MTLITKINVQHVRVHEKYSLDISPNVTVITGPNGSGKTTLIEALYIALQGTSFKGVDGDILAAGAPWYRIDVVFDEGVMRSVKFDPAKTTGRKQFILDKKTHYRLTPANKYPVVLFEPEDLRLLSGSPTRRRQFIDRFISQLDPQYSIALRRYERALKQRNALLKQYAATSDSLFVWDVSLSEHGAYIISQRTHFIGVLNEQLDTVYGTISGGGDYVSVRYSAPIHANVKQKLLADLHRYIDKDKLLGFTSVGPHRDDLLFDFNHSPALTVASRGEVRSVILALKFLEVQITEQQIGKKPVILLDDVFSELDITRQKNLVTEFTDHQIIIASVDTQPLGESKVIRLTA